MSPIDCAIASALQGVIPFALSLSKRVILQSARSCFDRLSTNGGAKFAGTASSAATRRRAENASTKPKRRAFCALENASTTPQPRSF